MSPIITILLAILGMIVIGAVVVIALLATYLKKYDEFMRQMRKK